MKRQLSTSDEFYTKKIAYNFHEKIVSYYRTAFPLDKVVNLLFGNTLVSNMIDILVNQNFGLELSFMISRIDGAIFLRHLDIRKKDLEEIEFPSESRMDVARMVEKRGSIENFKEVVKKFIHGLFKQNMIANIHFKGFRALLAEEIQNANSFPRFQTQLHPKNTFFKNYVLDFDMSPSSSIRQLIKAPAVCFFPSSSERSNEENNFEADSAIFKLVLFELCCFWNMILISKFSQLGLYKAFKDNKILVYRVKETKKFLQTFDPVANNLDFVDVESTFKFYFSGLKGMHIWFPNILGDMENSDKAVDLLFQFGLSSHVIKLLASWMYQQTNSITTDYPDSLKNCTHVSNIVQFLVSCVNFFELDNYTNENFCSSMSQIGQSSSIVKTSSLKNCLINFTHSIQGYNKNNEKRDLKSILSEKSFFPQIVDNEDLFGKEIVYKIYLSLVYFNPRLIMDTAPNEYGHAIKLPYCYNLVSGLRSFEIPSDCTFNFSKLKSHIKSCIHEQVVL